jgi:hypothetical protein
MILLKSKLILFYVTARLFYLIVYTHCLTYFTEKKVSNYLMPFFATKPF